jgi:KDO2-lipid IV(A) lauroyltransferase
VAKRKAYRPLLYVLFLAAVFVLERLPRNAVLALARWGGRAAFMLVPRHRRKTLEHLARAFGGEMSAAGIERLGRRVFENLAETGADLLLAPKMARSGRRHELIDYGEAPRVYREILAEGRGLIAITAHLGNWELMAGAMALEGFQGAVLGRRLRYAPFDRWVVARRLAMGVATVYRDESARKIFDILASGRIVGLLPDQDIDSVRGIFVPFFGRPAYTPVAPVKLALASGAPIVVNFMVRRPGGRYAVELGGVIRPRVETTREAAVRDYTAAWMAAFERMIRAHPEQWAWMHDRWKTQPARSETVSAPFTMEKVS